MSEGCPPQFKSSAEDKVLDKLHLRRASSRHPAYCRILQPLPQRTDDQQDGSRLRTIVKYRRNAQLVGSIGKRLAFVEQRARPKPSLSDDYRVIYGHKILAGINTQVENSLVREIASPVHLQCPLSITMVLNLKPRGNPTNRVPEVTGNLHSLQADAVDALCPGPRGKNYPRQHQQSCYYRKSPPVNATTKAGRLGCNGGKVYRLQRGPGTVSFTLVKLRRGVQGIATSQAFNATRGLPVITLRANNRGATLTIRFIHRHSPQPSTGAPPYAEGNSTRSRLLIQDCQWVTANE
jgi:hypothetical protein